MIRKLLSRASRRPYQCLLQQIQELSIPRQRVYDGNCWSQWVVCDWVFTVVGFIRDNGKWSYFRSCTRCCWDRNKFRLLTSNGNLKARLRISMNFLNQVTEVHFWLFVEEPHNFGRIHWWSTTENDRMVSGLKARMISVPRSTVVISGSGSTSAKDLVNHLVATKVKLFDDTIKETKLYHSVVCNDHDTFNVTTFFVGIQLNHVQSMFFEGSFIHCMLFLRRPTFLIFKRLMALTLSPTELRP